MTKSENGFSLVEVMATLAVMALAIGMVASSVGASLTLASRQSDDPTRALRRVMSVIGSAIATPAPAGGLARIAPIFGDERRLYFLTADESDDGFMANRFAATPKGLTWVRSPIRQERELVNVLFPEDSAIQVPHLPDMRFAYRAAGEIAWRSEWSASPSAPALVRVEISAKGGRMLSGVVRIGSTP